MQFKKLLMKLTVLLLKNSIKTSGRVEEDILDNKINLNFKIDETEKFYVKKLIYLETILQEKA